MIYFILGNLVLEFGYMFTFSFSFFTHLSHLILPLLLALFLHYLLLNPSNLCKFIKPILNLDPILIKPKYKILINHQRTGIQE